MSKIKVFLGGYLNQTNAQNLNCLTLAKHLNKDKFEVYSLVIARGNLPIPLIKGLKTFCCFKPVRISFYIAYLWGIWNCDVAYLPRGNHYKYLKFLVSFFKVKSFKTIENILDDTFLPGIYAVVGNTQGLKANYSFCTRNYAITKFIKKYNYNRWGVCSEEEILPPPVDTELFNKRDRPDYELSEIIFVGNDMVRKGIFDYLELAEVFPGINFHVVGKPLDIDGIDNMKNVIVHGTLSSLGLKELFKQIDLHILPSRSEGFPRVLIETAAAGIPSITYGDYGADEWITHKKNGFVVKSLNDIRSVISLLKKSPEMLVELSVGLGLIVKKYNVKTVISQYARIIEELYNNGR